MIEQGSLEWLMQRCGKITASRFQDVIGKKKNGEPLKERENYLWELVIERITSHPQDHFVSAAMLWGTENEGLARMAYEARTGRLVEKVEFKDHPRLKLCGASADGIIDADGGWECKCPYNGAVHLRTFLEGMPEEHRAQVQGNMAVWDRNWWDFTSYDPRFEPPFDLYVERIPRDSAYIQQLEVEIVQLNKDVTTMLARLNMKGSVA